MRQTDYNSSGAIVRTQDWDATTYTARDAAGSIVAQRPVTAREQLLALADVQRTNADVVRDYLRASLQTNRAFLAVPTPTNAQVIAQVRALTQQNIRVTRLLAEVLDSPDD